MSVLKNHIILVTGASKGIGAAASLRLAAEGAHLVLVARSVKGLEVVDDQIQAIGGKATLVPLDLAKAEDIDALGAALYQKFGRIDGLVANAAALGKLAPLTHITPAQWQILMDVNVTANWRLIRILDPLLRKSDSPRAAFVTSGVTRMATPYWGGYAITKSALETLVLTYAAEVEDSNIRVNLIDPGVVATDMRASAFPGENASELMQPDNPRLTDLFVHAMSRECAVHGSRLEL